MKNRKKNGVRSTRTVNRTARDNFVSSSIAGNKVQSKLSPEGLARLKKVKDFMAKKSKFVRAQEFAGKGKTIEILDVEDEVNGKFGDTIQIKLREPKTNIERIWSTSSIRALNAIYPLIEKGVTLIHVWTTGKDMDTQYYAKDVRHQGGDRKPERSE